MRPGSEPKQPEGVGVSPTTFLRELDVRIHSDGIRLFVPHNTGAFNVGKGVFAVGVEGAEFDDDDADDPPNVPPWEPGDDLADGDGTEVHERGNTDTDEGFVSNAAELSHGPWRVGAEIHGFRLQKLLGQGATGAVFSALNLDTQSTVALKVLIHSDANTINRLKRGFRSLAEVFHPNLVMLYGLYQHQERCFITMEQVDGLSLIKAIRAEQISDPVVFYERVNAILREAGRALHALHSNQLVHRDIKPNNLLIDPTGRLRLIDYGMVGSYDPIWDPDGHRAYVAGNKKYMAPEVLIKQNYPPGSDLFSLGRVIVRLIRHCHPHRGSMQMDREQMLPVDVPRPLAKLIHRMLSAEVSDRPTAWEVASAAGDVQEATTSLLVNPCNLRIIGRDEPMRQTQRWLSRMVGGQTRRLHISGPPGIGKTRFVAAVAEQFAEHKWLQVFESRCRRREEVPLQAFDEMVDALARRYSGPNAGQLELDPVSTQILRSSFPVLCGVLKKAAEVARNRSLGQAEAKDASIQLTTQVCRHGPVILIIDDLQWADKDSLALIRRLENEVTGLFGVITASRDDFQPPHVSATNVLKLNPLTVEESTRLLQNHLLLSRITLPDAVITRVAQHAKGNSNLLLQLAACLASLKPSEIAAWLGEGTFNVQPLWQHRFGRLTPHSRLVLTSVVAAGGPVDIDAVLEVTNLKEAGRATVSKLLQENWVNERERTHHIEIFHETIGDALIEFLPPEQLRDAHAKWAEWLVQSESHFSSARIAGHLLQANQRDRATEFAIRAAQEAEVRFAYGEAARWHHQTSQLTTDDAAIEHLRQAAEAFVIAGQSTEAAKTFMELAAHPKEKHPARFRGLATESFIRAGKIGQAREVIKELASSLDLPVPRARWRSFLSILYNLARLRMRGGFSLPEPTHSISQTSDRAQTCFRLSQALSFYDNVYAADLLITGLRRIKQFDNPAQCVHAGVAYSVFGNYDVGWWRKSSARLMPQLTAAAEACGRPETLAHLSSAIGYQRWLKGDFAESLLPLEQAVFGFRNQCRGMVFESVHTQMSVLCSYFFLGQISSLTQQTQEMIRDSQERDDRFTLDVATTGFAAAAFLFLGDVRSAKQHNGHLARKARHDPGEFFFLFQLIGASLQKMHAGRPLHASRLMDRHERTMQKSIFGRVQITRIWWQWLRGTVALQLASGHSSQASPALRQALRCGKRLAKEQLPLAQVMSDLIRGRIFEISDKADEAAVCYSRVAGAADLQQLEPFRLLALDGLDLVSGNRLPESRLTAFLADANVHDPIACQRLYTAPR